MNIFAEKERWKSSNKSGEYFEKMKLLRYEHQPTPYELYRVNLSKRSYEKEENMLNGKSFVCRGISTRNFSDAFKINNDLSLLSKSGKLIIKSFLKDNKEKEDKLRQKEKELFENRRFRQGENKKIIWKPALNIKEYFSLPPADKGFIYKKKQKMVHLITEPFRIPKKDGTYFDKEIKRIT